MAEFNTAHDPNAVLRRAQRALPELLAARPGHRPAVADLADAVGVSAAKLRRLLRIEGGPRPKALITMACLHQAAQLIRRGTKIDAARRMVGFQQKTNFNRQFRRLYAHLPVDYRRLVCPQGLSYDTHASDAAGLTPNRIPSA
jgi:AraC-like DNA-binding protein